MGNSGRPVGSTRRGRGAALGVPYCMRWASVFFVALAVMVISPLILSAHAQDVEVEAAEPVTSDEAADEAAEPEATAEDPESEPMDTTAEDTEAAAEAAGKPNVWYKGRFNAEIDARSAGGDTDVDLSQTLALDITPPKYPKLTIRGLLWLNEDLDSDHENSALADIDDAYNASVRGKLLHLYVELDDVWGDSTLRIGRQRILESPVYNRIDGIFFKKDYGKVDWYAFAGARASIYDDAHDDLVIGGGTSAWVTPKTRIALDAFYAEEDRSSGNEVYRFPWHDWLGSSYPRRVKTEVDSRQISLTVMHYLNERHSLFGRYTLHDGDSDEIQLTATGVFAKREIVYNVSYRRRLDLLEDRANDVTGFYRIVGVWDEYDDLFATVQVPMTEKLTLGLEGQIHESHGDNRNNANRDYWRGAVVLGVDELAPNLDLTAALEYWDVSDGEGVWAITGDIVRTWERWKLTVGADYERYEDRVVEYQPEYFWAHQGLAFFLPRYFFGALPWYRLFDVDVVETHENIYTVYGKVDYKFRENQDMWMRLTFEEDDGPDSPYWRLQAGYTIRF